MWFEKSSLYREEAGVAKVLSELSWGSARCIDCLSVSEKKSKHPASSSLMLDMTGGKARTTTVTVLATGLANS
jgi:hypothetical protein